MSEETSTYYTVSLALNPALVRDAEAAVERLNQERETARPVGLADLVTEAIEDFLYGRGYVVCWEHRAIYGGPVCPAEDHFPSHTAATLSGGCEREELDADDAARLAGYFR